MLSLVLVYTLLCACTNGNDIRPWRLSESAGERYIGVLIVIGSTNFIISEFDVE